MKRIRIVFLMILFCLCCQMNVAAKVTLTKTAVTMETGKTRKLRLKGASSSIDWKSENASVASVSNKGVITARKEGITTITATYKDKTYSCRVKVIQNKRTARFLSIIRRYAKTMNADIANGKVWTYGLPECSSFAKSRGKYRKTTCVYPVIWALREMRIFGSSDGFWAGEKKILYYGRGRKKATSAFHYYHVDRNLSELMEKNLLQPGDILFYEYHTNIYAGNQLFYDTGRLGTNGEFKGKTYCFSSTGPMAFPFDAHVNYILRFK